MQLIWSLVGGKPRLEDWLNRPFSPTVEQGPRVTDRCDRFERMVAVETAGEPEPGGPHRRVARAIFAFEVFPPTLVSPVLLRSPLQVGDTVGILFHFLPGFDLFCGARVLECFDERETASGTLASNTARWLAIRNWARRRTASRKTWRPEGSWRRCDRGRGPERG